MIKIILVVSLVLLSGCATLTGNSQDKPSVISELVDSGCQIKSYHHVSKLGVTDIKCEVYKYD